MHFLENSMFVLNAYFCRELRFVAILRSRLRFLLRNTWVDSDFTQNFWVKNWRLKALLQASPTAICKLARFLKLWPTLTTSVLLPIKDRSAGHRICWWRSCFTRKMAARQHTHVPLLLTKLESAFDASRAKRILTVVFEGLEILMKSVVRGRLWFPF